MNISDEALLAAAKTHHERTGSFWADADPAWRLEALADMLAALEAAAPHMLVGVTALADAWETRGEYDMAYSKTVTDEHIAIQLLQAGAQMVDDARLVRNAIGTPASDVLADAWDAGREVGLAQDFDATTQITNPYRPTK